MPWIHEESCTGCGVCVDECPVDAISMEVDSAAIDMAECIRCGVCHDICPVGSVRHDGEKVPDRIAENVDSVKRYMSLCEKYLGDAQEGEKCLRRLKRHFMMEKKIAEQTLQELEKLG